MRTVEVLEHNILEYWDRRTTISSDGKWRNGCRHEAQKVIEEMDRGEVRVAEQDSDSEYGWRVKEWVKKAVLLYFMTTPPHLILGPGNDNRYDIASSKFRNWDDEAFKRAGIRAALGSNVRKGAFIGKRVVLMPSSFVNIGGYVGEGTMVDTGARVGSCAQIGKNVHLSGGVGIGGVLEPSQARPTIIEDDCFIGANSEVAEGVVVMRGAVLSMGCFIGANTPIVNDLEDGTIIRGYVPENAVVMPGIHPNGKLSCPHIVKLRDEGTDAKVALNDALRQFS